jgi:PAS domain S-box-containing protein
MASGPDDGMESRPGGRQRRRVSDAFERHGSLEGIALADEIDTILVEGAADFAIFAMDGDGRIASWNTGAQRLTQYAPEEVMGRPFDFLWVPEDLGRKLHLHELQQSAARGFTEDENWVRRKDGSRFWANGTTRGLRDAEGRLRGYVKVMRDLTAQREAEERAKAAHERLVRFQHQVVHELRNPLSPLLIQLQVLEMTQLDARQAKAVDVLKRNLWRMKRLCDDLADASRLEMGNFPVARVPVELGRLVREAVDTLEGTAQEAGITLQADLSQPAMVSGDPHRLVQVVHNLVANALRFTAPGGRVVASLAVEGDRAVVRVRDTGLGLTPQQMAQLFLPFAQVHAGMGTSGMGLGLYLSKAIVQAHDGRMDVQSEGPGKGATFLFEIPLLEHDRRLTSLGPPGADPSSAAPRSDRPAD